MKDEDNPNVTPPSEMPSSPCNSSLPKPTFFEEPMTFSTKKERKPPRVRRPPPRPPAKTCPPISRVFRRRPDFYRPQSITFLESPDGSLTGKPLEDCPLYDTTKKKSYFEQAFTIQKKIGAGYFGTVYKVKSREDGKLYAVKIAKDLYQGQSDRMRKVEEVRKHQFLPPHTNCVHFYQSWEENGRLYQQFELCDQSLLELTEQNHEIPESLIWNYLVDLLLALEHLHDHDLVHMDIKPENIFIGRDGICKLGDFGLMIDLAKGDLNTAAEGDPKYLAKEILERRFTKAADVFSLGTTILELACDLDLPSNGELWHRLRDLGPDPSTTTNLSPEMRRVIELMMTKDCDRRPTVKQLLQLPSIKKAKRRRQRQLALQGWITLVKTIFSPILRLLMIIFGVFVFPFTFVSDRIRSMSEPLKTSTPTHRGNGSGDEAAAMDVSNTFSSDDECEFSLSSSLARPLGLDDSFEDDPLLPDSSCDSEGFVRPQFAARGPRRYDEAQTTPGLGRYRSRFMARRASGLSPSKRLLFDSGNSLDNSIVQTPDDEDDSDPALKMKPVNLAHKYDYFSDDD